MTQVSNILKRRLEKTLAGPICSAQSLDASADRARTLKEIIKTLEGYKLDLDYKSRMLDALNRMDELAGLSANDANKVEGIGEGEASQLAKDYDLLFTFLSRQ